MIIDRILVPLDGSERAEAALETAIDFLGEQPDATLVLLRAVETPRAAGADPMDERARDVRTAHGYLNGVVAGLRICGIGRVKAVVWYGPAATTIVDIAEAEKVDLIVMSSHGGGAGPIFGSIAEAIRRGTRTPVVFVRDIGASLSPFRGGAETGPTGRAGATGAPS
jgi:nucleotide-binding universal stress UspA family protein